MVAKAKSHPNWEKRKTKRKKKGTPPSYEEFLEAKLEQERLQKKHDILKQYQKDVIHYGRSRMSDTDNPPSKAELKVLQDVLENGPIQLDEE